MTLRTAAPPTIETELLIVPWFETEDLTTFPGLDDATAGETSRALASGEFKAHLHDVFVTPVRSTRWRARRIMLAGAGLRSECSHFALRRLATSSALAARQRRVESLAFMLRGEEGAADPARVALHVQAIAEGLTLAEFDGGTYKTSEPLPGYPVRCAVVVPGPAGSHVESSLLTALNRGRTLGECSNLARGLANEPGNTLTPREFASRASAIAIDGNVAAEVLDEKRIAELGMGLLLGVARGSSEPPRLMVFRHTPAAAPSSGPVLGLIGKGITFDTGGISIKPAVGMEQMKDDMAGGAAVACAMRAIGLLNAPIQVIGIVPATENMPSGRAIKPGDVLKSAEGKTVEVINTDAEGRLVLGDALWYAGHLGATHLVDVATLTGAVVVALGHSTSGILGTPAGWVDHVKRVADCAGDRVWPLPLFDDYREQLESDIADLKNTGGRPAGTITAAMFLKEFTAGLPWAHIDIAGTAWAGDAKPYQPKGPTGVAVRTLAELAFTSDAWPG
jgi:leucyl aminopeptidase